MPIDLLLAPLKCENCYAVTSDMRDSYKKELAYFFLEFACESGLRSSFGSQLEAAENCFTPHDGTWDGPIPTTTHTSTPHYQDPYDDAFLVRIGNARACRSVLKQMQEAGHCDLVTILHRLYGPQPVSISAFSLVFGDLAPLVDLTRSWEDGVVKASHMASEEAEEVLRQQVMDAALTIKVQAGLLRRQAEDMYVSMRDLVQA